MRSFKSVPIPARMQHLPLDPRGLPIPENVLLDKNGKPHFTINDQNKRQSHLTRKKCPICGGSLLRGRWTVGGPASAFMENGAYIDPPMHYECYRYAMQVCPYLALPTYTKRIDAGTLRQEDVGDTALFVDPTVLAERPPIFVGVMHIGEHYHFDRLGQIATFKPKRPYKNIEFWKDGEELPYEEGKAIAERYLAERGTWIIEQIKQSKGPQLVNVKSREAAR